MLCLLFFQEHLGILRYFLYYVYIVVSFFLATPRIIHINDPLKRFIVARFKEDNWNIVLPSYHNIEITMVFETLLNPLPFEVVLVQLGLNHSMLRTRNWKYSMLQPKNGNLTIKQSHYWMKEWNNSWSIIYNHNMNLTVHERMSDVADYSSSNI